MRLCQTEQTAEMRRLDCMLSQELAAGSCLKVIYFEFSTKKK